MTTKYSMRTASLASLLFLAACGPVAIGVGLGSGGGGGGGPGTPNAPTLLAVQAPFQPADNATLVGLRLAQSDRRPARLRFEYDIGQGRVRVPASSIARYDVAARSATSPLAVDAAGDFVAATDGGGVNYFFLWQHEVDLAQVEQRGVTLYAVFVDADGREGFASTAGNSVALLTGATVGRQVAQVSNVSLQRLSTDPESAFVISAELRDRGADRAFTGWQFEYATTASEPAEGDFVALPEQQPASVSDEEQPDGSLRSNLTFQVDPLALNLPLGQFDKFWVRVTHRESYPQERSDLPQTVKFGPSVLLGRDDEQIGFEPRIELATVVDPNSNQTSLGDDGRPWLKLPISMRVFNPSPNLPMQVRVDGTYTIGNTTLPITPFEGGNPGSSVLFTLAPQERRRQFLIWNVVADEGLGNSLVLDPPNSVVRVADINVKATLVGAGSSTLAGSALQSQRNAGFTTLSTNPFVGFRDNLAQNVVRAWSSGDEVSQKTRDLYFTRQSQGAQELRILLDQQFEPLQIVPPPPAFDFSQPPYNFVQGVFDIVATDFEEGIPDCLAWVNSQFFYLTWPNSDGAVVQPLFGQGATLQARGNGPIFFKLTDSSGGIYSVALFYTWGEASVLGGKDVTVLLTAVVRDPQGGFDIVNGPANQVFNIEGTPPVNIQPVGGSFDSNAATYEVVLGTLGTEYATAGRPGMLHMWSFSVGANGVTIAAPVALPAVPPPTSNPTQSIDPWLMTAWRPSGQTREGLVVVRQLSGFPRRFDVWSLPQLPAGGFAPAWGLVTEELAATQSGFEVGGNNLRRIFAKDLDGTADGRVGSDLLLVLDERLDPQGGPVERYGDVWLWAERGNGPPQWRRIVNNLQVIDPVTLQPVVGEMDCSYWQLVDVNGDRLLDLVTSEALVTSNKNPLRQYNYLASSLAGVAGKLGGVGTSAGASSFRSVLPGLLDVNQDGYTDIITGSRLHLANLDGSYSQSIGGFSGSSTSRYRVERMWLGQPAGQIEVVVFDPDNASQDRIDRLNGLGSETYSVTSMLGYDFGGAVQELRPMMATDSASRGVKDLVALVGTGASGQLRRGRIDAAAMTMNAQPMWNGIVDVTAGMAMVRRAPLASGSVADENEIIQDVVVADAQTPGRLVVCQASNGYAPSFISLPSGQRAVRLAEGAITADQLEDVCVLTVETLNQGTPNEESVYRVVCVQQLPSAGITQASPQLELSRFTRPYAATAIRSFQFDRGAAELAKGFLLIDDEGALARSEARLLLPTMDGAALGSRVLLSPIDQSVDFDIDAVVLDADQDGQIEVIGGDRSPANGLRRLRTNLAPAGF